MELDMLDTPLPPMLTLCTRPGPLLTNAELPELPTIVPELSALHSRVRALSATAFNRVSIKLSTSYWPADSHQLCSRGCVPHCQEVARCIHHLTIQQGLSNLLFSGLEEL